jgi:hypothetical protein
MADVGRRKAKGKRKTGKVRGRGQTAEGKDVAPF